MSGNFYLGQYVVNLGVHQSSSMSVLSHTEYFSTDLQGSDRMWLTAVLFWLLWKMPPAWYLPEAEGVWLCPCDFVSPSITVMECLARCRCLGNHLQKLSLSFQRDPPTERTCLSNGCKNKYTNNPGFYHFSFAKKQPTLWQESFV